MTVPDLIGTVLESVYKKFYVDREVIFYRDKTHIVKAITRYGHECHSRGWSISLKHIEGAIFKILEKTKVDEVRYLPVYLEKAVDQHVRERSEELHDIALNINTQTGRIRIPKPTNKTRTLSDCDVMSRIYVDLKTKMKNKRRKADATQKEMFK